MTLGMANFVCRERRSWWERSPRGCYGSGASDGERFKEAIMYLF